MTNFSRRGQAHPKVRVAAIAAAVLAMAWTALASAQAYPNRPVRLVVPFAAGTNVDNSARQIAPKLSEALGQPVVIENKPGAGGTIASALVAGAKPDGYTVLLGNAPTHGLAPSIYKDLSYDPVKDFTAIGRIDTAVYVLGVSTKVPATTVTELIAYARAHPGKLNYASTGIGTGTHLAGARFAELAGIDIRHVAYNAVGPMTTDLNSGEVSMIFYPYQPLKPMVEIGAVRLVATTGHKRASYLANLPTMAEAGLPGFVAFAWHGLYGPAGMAPKDVDVMYAALAKAVSDPALRPALLSMGAELDLAPPAEFAAFTKSEVVRFATLVKAANVKAE